MLLIRVWCVMKFSIHSNSGTEPSFSMYLEDDIYNTIPYHKVSLYNAHADGWQLISNSQFCQSCFILFCRLIIVSTKRLAIPPVDKAVICMMQLQLLPINFKNLHIRIYKTFRILQKILSPIMNISGSMVNKHLHQDTNFIPMQSSWN
jgi:hypothetical protein